MIEQLLLPEVQKFIKDHCNDDPFLLSLSTKQSENFPLKVAVEQIRSYQKARTKAPSWIKNENVVWPPSSSVEQASSETTARFKSSLIRGELLADLSGGMGIDAVHFSNKFKKVHYVEKNHSLCDIARHNFQVLQAENIEVHHQSAEEFVEEMGRHKSPLEMVYIDPSRRDNSRKVFKIEDCSPNLFDIIPKCKPFTNQMLIKLSPLVDISFLIRAFQPANIWIVALKNEVKEILCLIGSKTGPTEIRANELDVNGNTVSEFTFYQEEESESSSAMSDPLKYLYEPNSSILKAGAFKLIGKQFSLKKLHQHTHLYTSDQFIKGWLGKIFLIKSRVKARKKEIHRLFPNKKVNVITRNYPLSASQLKSRFGLRDGGEEFLIGCTLKDGKNALLRCGPIRRVQVSDTYVKS